MIYFKFSIANPFAKSAGSGLIQSDYIEIDKSVSKNKAFSIQFSRWATAWEIFHISIDTQLSGHDHAGLELQLEILGFFFDMRLYDKRHWDYEKGTWEVYDETYDTGN